MIGPGLPVGTFLRLAIAVSQRRRAPASVRSRSQGHQSQQHPHRSRQAVTLASPVSASRHAFRASARRLEPPELIAGTLSHMAPEQTGRMNRSIDSRSDLYSLGITLYHALTGTPSLHRQRTDGVGALPHCEKADAAESASRSGSAAARCHRHEAAREDARGTLPDSGRTRA